MHKRPLFLLVLVLLGGAFLWFLFGRSSLNTWPIVNESPSGSTIVALGDSLTFGYGLAPEQSYPAQLAARLGRPVINAGINGNTTEDALRRLDQDVLARDPAVVLVCLGGNDMRQKWDLERTMANLREITERLQASGALVVLIGIEGDGLIYSNDQGEAYEALAREKGAVYVPNMLKGVLGHPSLMHDPLHPNAAGYEKFVDRLTDIAGDYLEH
ncbi:MAG: acyl-CoA thioesterase [Candidatus Sumerlaeota bacterium]|nr:acyl-CoA thioesterase [Candidatus Sumerlaeota bacterium]